MRGERRGERLASDEGDAPYEAMTTPRSAAVADTSEDEELVASFVNLLSSFANVTCT
jgi:hypothetical protein